MSTRHYQPGDCVGLRVEAHPHRGRIKAGTGDAISVRVMPDGKVFYVAVAVLFDVTFVVQHSAHQRSIQNSVRNVHAWARGTLVSTQSAASSGDHYITRALTGPQNATIDVGYNPFRTDTFREITGHATDGSPVYGRTVIAAEQVTLSDERCWADNPTFATP